MVVNLVIKSHNGKEGTFPVDDMDTVDFTGWDTPITISYNDHTVTCDTQDVFELFQFQLDIYLKVCAIFHFMDQGLDGIEHAISDK